MLTSFDKALLNVLQANLPIAVRPFQVLAEQLGTDEETVLNRVKALKQAGYIRRIGPFFDSEQLGYIGTLVAAQVDRDAMAAVAAVINDYSGITHNYEREGHFNLWFTLLAPNAAMQQEILARIESLPGVVELVSLPATKKFKVNVQFTLE